MNPRRYLPRSRRFLILVSTFALLPSARAYVTVSGSITSDTTWGASAPATDGIYWVTPSVSIGAGARLTIEPGVIVKFSAGASIYVGDGSGTGILDAAGAAGNPIVFTSIKDDTGGDTNGDGTATSPAPGDWGGLFWNRSGSSGLLEHAVVRYGGSSNSAISFSNAAPSRVAHVALSASASVGIDVVYATPAEISDSVVAGSAGFGLRAAYGYFPATFTGNTITGGASYPVAILPEDVPGLDPGNVFTGNQLDAIHVYGGTIASGTHVWPDLPVPFVLDATLTLSGGTLTLPPGAILKMDVSDPSYGRAQMRVVGGTLDAIGTAAAPIVFTSTRDDAHGGDTNGDGGASSPAPGDWRSIFLVPGNGAFAHVKVLYAGYGDGCAVCYLSGTVTQISDSEISASSGTGLRTQSGMGLTDLSRNTVTGCATTGMLLALGTVPASTSGNVISGNGAWPIELNAADVSKLATDNAFTGNVKNGIHVMQGTLAGAHTWPIHGVPYHMGGSWTQVNAGASLTLPPGSILKMASGTGFSVYGALVADGDPGSPITFTSEKDDSIGGDTNGDGAATSPAAGDWDQLYYESGASGILDRCVIRYAGRNSTPAVYCYRGAPSQVTSTTIASSYAAFRTGTAAPGVFSGNTVAGCTSYGVYFTTAGYVPATIAGNTVTGCGAWPIALLAADARRLAADNVFTGNVQNVVWLTASAFPVTAHVWNRFDAPYHLSASLTIQAGASLTIAPGSVVKMGSPPVYLAVSGSLVAEGTQLQPITFTSFRDDTVGGDSNGDGGATVPAAGNWTNVWIWSGGQASMKHATVRYGGSQPTVAMLDAQPTSTLTIEDSVVSDSLYRGIGASGAATSVAVRRTDIERNAVGVYVASGSPLLGGAPGDGNTFAANGTYAVQNAGSVCINAQYNDWGAPDGPYDGSSSPDACGLLDHLGGGQTVSNNVDYGGPAPLGLTATPYNTVVDLSWKAVADVSGYHVYRALASGGPFAKITATPHPATTYRDTNLTNGTTYFYVVRAVSEQQAEGRASNEASATPSTAGGVTPVTDLRVTVSGNDLLLEWTPITTENGVQYYRVYLVSPASTPPYDRASGTIIGLPGGGSYLHIGAATDPSSKAYDVATVDNLGDESAE